MEIQTAKETSILGGFRAVPTGLRLIGGGTHPTLKRGANNHCAYGADGRLPLEKLADRYQSEPLLPPRVGNIYKGVL
jgi:hypothetical protein